MLDHGLQTKMSYKRSRANFESDAQPQHAPFAFYGTPLPVYDPESRDDGSYVPVWKQEVTDERGRKRLHGAFTGGFSAGYSNTVGSKEGWAPSTFVSSRANRQKEGQKAKEQRPEDFMDEEDLAEQAEAQKLETQNSFAGLGSTEEDGVRKGMFSDLFKTSGETMGMKLLQKMGWRQGQGVGPKVQRKARSSGKAVDEQVHLFAPENSRMISFARKNDRKGLGFAGEDRLNSEPASNSHPTPMTGDGDNSDEDAKMLRLSRSNKAKLAKKPKKTGIGVGILNDNSDEDDPYAMGPQISYNRIIGGDKKKKKGLTVSNANPLVAKPVLTSKKLAQRTTTSAGFRKCHDGRLPLDGFVLATTLVAALQENKFEPPTIPEGWVSAKISVAGKSGKDATYQSTADVAKSSTLDPKARAALLGESQLPGKSVFDFLTPSARDRLANASGKSNLPQALCEAAPKGFEASEADKRRSMWDLVPQLDKQTAAAALSRGTGGWMPYAEDEAKRARYRYFLELRAGLKDALPERAKGISTDDWQKELREFAQAAEVFKPISGMMASRFTSSSTAPRLATDAPDPAPKPVAKPEDPAEAAAKVGMYGPMTRSCQPFYPTRLLCKRFNIKPPANMGATPGEEVELISDSKRLDVVSQASIEQMMREASFKAPATGNLGTSVSTSETQSPAMPLEQAEVNVETNEALEGKKAGEAVFKAIFGSDDEDE